MMWKILLAVIGGFALSAPLPAAAFIHGTAILPSQTEIFGAKTRAGAGGTAFGFTSGLLSVSNVRDSGGSLAQGLFTIDLNGDLVLCSSVACPGTYGASPPSLPSPYYTATIVARSGAAFVATLTIDANEATVKSHYNFAHNPDTTSNFQLATLLNSSSILADGDTIVCRDGAGSTGLAPALNPLALAASRYIVTPPASGYVTGINHVTVISEHPDNSTDLSGRPNNGGGCNIGSLTFSSSTLGDNPVNLKFKSISFASDSPTGMVAIVLGWNNAAGKGIDCDHCRFQIGPDVTPAYLRINNVTVYAGHSPAAMTNSTLIRGQTLALIGHNNGVSAGAPDNAGTTVSGNFFRGANSDMIDSLPFTGGHTITGNVFSDWEAGGPDPVVGDQYVIGAKTYSIASAITGGGDVDGNVLLDPDPAKTMINFICSVNAGGSITLPGSALSPFTCASGVDYPASETADANVVATVGPGNAFITNYQVKLLAANTVTVNGQNPGLASAARASSGFFQNLAGTATITSITSGTSGYLNFQPDHADTFQYQNQGSTSATLAGTTYANNFSVRNAGTPNADGAQTFFGNKPHGSTNDVVTSNISFHTLQNQALMADMSNPSVTANTMVSDVESNAYAPLDPTYDIYFAPDFAHSINGGGVITVGPPNGAGGGTFSGNISNIVNIASQTGSPTVTPNPNEAVNVFTGGFSPTTAFSVMSLIFPNLPAGFQTTLTNRPNIIMAFTPAPGSMFTASLVSGSFTMTCSSACPPPSTTVNGPGLPSGDIILSSSGTTATLSQKATANETAQTYGTGAMNPGGDYNGALWPANIFNEVCWNVVGTVPNPAAHCPPAM